MTAPTFRDVRASGIRLRVTDLGNGPTILLLHTALLDRTCWNGILEPLAERFRVVAPDLPGFGESEKPGTRRFSYTVQAFTHVVMDLYAGLELGQAYVIGHGLGGAIALCLAGKNPELVSRLMLTDALCYPSRPDIARRVAGLPLFGGLIFKQLCGWAAFRSYFQEVLLSPTTQGDPARVEHYYQAFNSPTARNSALATLRATLDTRPIVAQLARISTPTLVTWGRHDAVYPAAFGQRLARDIRGAGFELFDSGHVPQEERPEEFSASALRFLLANRG